MPKIDGWIHPKAEKAPRIVVATLAKNADRVSLVPSSKYHQQQQQYHHQYRINIVGIIIDLYVCIALHCIAHVCLYCFMSNEMPKIAIDGFSSKCIKSSVHGRHNVGKECRYGIQYHRRYQQQQYHRQHRHHHRHQHHHY
jgi:hypothetical protein